MKDSIFDTRYDYYLSDDDDTDRVQKWYAYIAISRPSGTFANVKSAFVAESISSFHIIANITSAVGGDTFVCQYVCVYVANNRVYTRVS